MILSSSLSFVYAILASKMDCCAIEDVKGRLQLLFTCPYVATRWLLLTLYFMLKCNNNRFLCAHCQWSFSRKSNARLKFTFPLLLWCQQHFEFEFRKPKHALRAKRFCLCNDLNSRRSPQMMTNLRNDFTKIF